ncbi:NACHT domain-containing protein [Chloroflexia bacterium SDU3-3]|nr:NACHT domain-containing protein [Chloroflexia bacterium SDU3-3]
MATPPDPSKPNGPAPHYEQPNWQVQQVINAQHVTMNAPERPAPPMPPPDPNRIKMLKQARQQVGDVLHTSLWNEARLALRLAKGTARPYNVELQAPELPPVLLPQDTKITEVYDQYQHQNLLLILGEPGGGKTTLLLELAEQLLDRAEVDAAHPLPVVFTLSTWGKEKPAVHDWMVEQLHRTYHVPKKIGVPWVEGGKILPLLDGLDEVDGERRAACVAAINAYRANHADAWATPMVVCCRSEEYRTLPALQGTTAITVQVLTHAEIDVYLAGGGRPLDGVRGVLRDDPSLYDLLKTPLLLSIIALAFADTPADDLRTATTPEVRKQAIFAAFVRRMFATEPPGRGEDACYSRRRILNGLRWLARQLDVSSLTLYLMELMQPHWGDRRWKRWLVQWSPGWFSGFVIGLVGMQFGSLMDGLLAGIAGVLCFGWFFGVYGEMVFRIGATTTQPIAYVYWSWSPLRTVWRPLLFLGICGGLVDGLGGVLFGVLVGMLYSSLSAIRMAPVEDIRRVIREILPNGAGADTTQPIDSLYWSWRSFRTSWREVLILGFLSWVGGWVVGGVVGGVFFGLIGGLVSGLMRGLKYMVSDTRSAPNEGIHHSSRNMLFGGLGLGVFGGLFGWLVGRLVGELGGVLFGGLVFGLIGGLLYGGAAVIQHYTLRLLLVQSGAMPWDIAAMLDAAARRSLLRRVGGGWVFTHRMLLEYFRDLSDEGLEELL